MDLEVLAGDECQWRVRDESYDGEVAADAVLLDDLCRPPRRMGGGFGRPTHHAGDEHHRLGDRLLGLGVPVPLHQTGELAHERRVHHVVVLGFDAELAMVATELGEELDEVGVAGFCRDGFEDVVDHAMEGDLLCGHRDAEQVPEVGVDREHPGEDVGREPVGLPVHRCSQLMQRVA